MTPEITIQELFEKFYIGEMFIIFLIIILIYELIKKYKQNFKFEEK